MSIRRFLRAASILFAKAIIMHATASTTVAATAAQPNFVVIVTDDQSVAMLDATPLTRSIVARYGTHFRRAYVEFALCSPSRATLLTGRYAHNHGIESNRDAFRLMTSLETGTVPQALRQAGYNTALIGKYMNGYPKGKPNSYVPLGWSTWVGLLSETVNQMYGYDVNKNGTVIRSSVYQTDFLAAEATQFIRQSANADKPFFLFWVSSAPHRPNIPAKRHRSLFGATQYPRTPAFNEANVADKPDFLRFAPLAPAVIADIDATYRDALRQLQAVDEAVRAMRDAVSSVGALGNTYFMFVSDDGGHDGEHRLGGTVETGWILGGKQLMYETDIRVPLLIRGPSVASGRIDDEHLVGTVDIAPTILDLAGLPVPAAMDGRSLRPLLGPAPPASWRQALPLARWLDPVQPDVAPAARGLRSRRYTWVKWASGERELYDNLLDPHQLSNVAADPSLAAVRAALAQRAGQLAACTGAGCRTAENQQTP